MGGAESEGNESPAAEFNFYADPEAAAVVFEKFKNIQLVRAKAATNRKRCRLRECRL